MKYIKGNDRGQIALIPTSLEEAIDENNEVQIIDLFCLKIKSKIA